MCTKSVSVSIADRRVQKIFSGAGVHSKKYNFCVLGDRVFTLKKLKEISREKTYITATWRLALHNY